MLLESIISSIFKSQFQISSIIFALVAINLNANIEFLPLHAEATLGLLPYIMISEDFWKHKLEEKDFYSKHY